MWKFLAAWLGIEIERFNLTDTSYGVHEEILYDWPIKK